VIRVYSLLDLNAIKMSKTKTSQLIISYLFLVLKKINSGINIFENWYPPVGLAMIALIIASISFMRYALSTSIIGLEEISVLLGLYAYYLGAGAASRLGLQIRVSIIDSVNMKPLIRQIISSVVQFISAIICLIFVYYIIIYWRWIMSVGMILEPLGWPFMVSAFSMGLGTSLMAIHYTVHFINNIRKLKTQVY